jgi:perosamine synthetase
MDRIGELVSRKREIFAYYQKQLSGLAGVSMNPEKSGTVNGYWMPTAVFAPETGVTRERLLELFKAENIDGRVFFHPLSSLPMFQAQPANRNSYDLPVRAINLPSYHDLTNVEQDRVIDAVKSVYRKE